MFDPGAAVGFSPAWRAACLRSRPENRAAVALLELADAAAVGAGEGALLVPEQLALQQVLRDGRAVEGQERGLSAGAVLVDGAGDKLLAGAALPGDQHGKGLVGDTADGLV